MTQHKELWDEISAWEPSIQFQCEEGVSMASQTVLAAEDYSTASTFIGIHKMLSRSVQLFQSAQPPELDAFEETVCALRAAALQSLVDAQPPLPTDVIHNEAAILLIDFHQVKVAWRRYWMHLEALAARLELLRYKDIRCTALCIASYLYRVFLFLRDMNNLEEWIARMEDRIDPDELGRSLEETLALTEEHQKFSRAVTLQEEKFKRLARFEMTHLTERDTEWEAQAQTEMLDNLERLNILPKVPPTPETVAVEEGVETEDLKEHEDIPLGKPTFFTLYKLYALFFWLIFCAGLFLLLFYLCKCSLKRADNRALMKSTLEWLPLSTMLVPACPPPPPACPLAA